MSEAGQNIRDYVVSVSLSESNPMILGPYTRARAQVVANTINRREEQRPEDERERDYVYATAQRIVNPTRPIDIIAEVFPS